MNKVPKINALAALRQQCWQNRSDACRTDAAGTRNMGAPDRSGTPIGWVL